MAADPEIDVVVELIGGADGIARRVIDVALDHGKHIVTANKALMAHHGTTLSARAEEKGVILSFEAAVAGGIPVIKTLREGLVGNRLTRLYGILNGTSNYILTTMRETAHEFAEVLVEAQKLGYAEADPSFDIDGIDARTSSPFSLVSGSVARLTSPEFTLRGSATYHGSTSILPRSSATASSFSVLRD